MAELNIRGRIITDSDIEDIRKLIESHKEKSRSNLSKILAEAWQWRQENGRLKDRACRALLSVLEQRQLITIPSLRHTRRVVKRNNMQTDFLFDLEPINQSQLNAVLPLQIGRAHV